MDLLQAAFYSQSALQYREAQLVNNIRNSYRSAWDKEIQPTLDTLLVEAAKGNPIDRALLARSDRYNHLLQQMVAFDNDWGNEIAPKMTLFRDTMAKAGIGTAYGLIGQFGGGFHANASILRLANPQLAAFDAFKTQAPQVEELFKQRFGERDYTKAFDAIERAILLGKNPRLAAREIYQNVSGVSLGKAELISRDMMVRTARAASQTMLERVGVSRYRRTAALNPRTCIARIALDGKIYSTYESMPLHPQDRCFMLPIFENTPLPNIHTGEQWFNAQPRRVQLEMLGAERYKLWDSGKARLWQFAQPYEHTKWGNSLRVTPVGDINPPVKKPTIGTEGRGAAARQRILEEKELRLVKISRLEGDIAGLQGRIDDTDLELDELDAAGIFEGAQYTDVWAKRRALQAERGVYMREVEDMKRDLYKGYLPYSPASREQVRAWFGESALEHYDEISEELGFMIHVVNPKYHLDNRGLSLDMMPTGRAHYTAGNKTVSVALDDNKRGVLVHELGHAIEDIDRERFGHAIQFRDYRTQGEEIKPLRDIIPNSTYRLDEVAKADKFESAYTGKVYIHRGQEYATEISSMGLQYMHQYPTHFAESDAEFFDFIWELYIEP